VRYANQLPPPIEGLIVSLKRDKPHWGALKIRELLVRRLDGDIRVPAKSRSTPCSIATAWSNASAAAVSHSAASFDPRASEQRPEGVRYVHLQA
jgi:hypothetical protein